MDVSDFDDIPGTTVFTAQRSHQGFHLNLLLRSHPWGRPFGRNPPGCC